MGHQREPRHKASRRFGLDVYGTGGAALERRLGTPPGGMHEPPGLSSDMFQWYLAEPLRVTPDGFIAAPGAPGLGVEPDPAKIARYRIS